MTGDEHDDDMMMMMIPWKVSGRVLDGSGKDFGMFWRAFGGPENLNGNQKPGNSLTFRDHVPVSLQERVWEGFGKDLSS